MCAKRIGCAHADPGEVRRKVVPALLMRYASCLGLLIKQVESFVAGEKIDPLQLARMHAHQAFHEAK